LNEVVFLRTHNSHSSLEAGYDTVAQNQLKDITSQLEDGVRSLNIDVYFEEGEVVVCHGACEFGYELYSKVLGDIEAFLRNNPFDVVLLDLQVETEKEKVAEVTEGSGVAEFLHVQVPGQPWPTLGEMVESGGRLVFFADRYVQGPSWYHAVEDFIYGTHWEAAYLEDLNCELTREPMEHGLFELNHIFTRLFARIEVSEEINYNPLLWDRIKECSAAVGRGPNLLSLDFYSHSDGLDAVDRLNRGE